jgi:Flp pilus assembly protein TadD
MVLLLSLNFNRRQSPFYRYQSSLDGWDCYQRAIASLNELTIEGNLRAQDLFRRAIEIDPKDSRPHAGLAYCLFRYSYDGYSDEQGYANEESVEHARRAIALDDGDAQAHEILAILLAHSNQLDAATAEARRAVDINPNFAHAYVPLGNSMSLAGRPAEGIPYLETAIRLNPDDIRGDIVTAYRPNTRTEKRILAK